MVTVAASPTPASLNKPVVGMAATPDWKGYWEVASDGVIFSFGDPAFFGARPDHAELQAGSLVAGWLVVLSGGQIPRPFDLVATSNRFVLLGPSEVEAVTAYK